MPRSTTGRLLAAVPFAAVALLLAACSAPDGEASSADNDAAAIKVVSCLNSAGQTAKILDGGFVGLLMPESEGGGDAGSLSMTSGTTGGGGDAAMVIMSVDDEGQWIASSTADGYPEDGGMREAWTECAEKFPDFAQPVPEIPDDAMRIDHEDVVAASLEFATCARENGFSDFADPDADGMLELPFGITEDELRSLMDSCYDEESQIGPMFTMDSVEAADFDVWAVMSDYLGGMIATPAMPIER